jgi:hypothetical protein
MFLLINNICKILSVVGDSVFNQGRVHRALAGLTTTKKNFVACARGMHTAYALDFVDLVCS